jgi:hypothetical protein
MIDSSIKTLEALKKLAAWHRINTDRAESDLVCAVRLRAADDLEGQAADLRGRLVQNSHGSGRRASQMARGYGDRELLASCAARSFTTTVGSGRHDRD